MKTHKKKVIAIASSDWHLHKFTAFDKGGSRLKISLDVMEHIFGVCKKYGVPLLFSGDLFHDPKEIENEVLGGFTSTYMKTFGLGHSFIAISGNHDMSQNNLLDKPSPTYLTALSELPHFRFIDNSYHPISDDILVWGVPYYKYQADWKQAIKKLTKVRKKTKGGKHILLLHGDAPGAVNTNGIAIEESELPRDLDSFFDGWDLVLFGHIHKPQKLSPTCYMIGSPIHQNRGDSGNSMGYWEVYSDLSMKFISLNSQYPTFIALRPEEYDEELHKKDYVDFIQDEPEEKELASEQFHIRRSRKALSKAYCLKKGIKDKKKIQTLIEILNSV